MTKLLAGRHEVEGYPEVPIVSIRLDCVQAALYAALSTADAAAVAAMLEP